MDPCPAVEVILHMTVVDFPGQPPMPMMETTSSFESPSVGCLTKVFASWMKPTTSTSSTFLLLRCSDYTVSSSTTDSDAFAMSNLAQLS